MISQLTKTSKNALQWEDAHLFEKVWAVALMVHINTITQHCFRSLGIQEGSNVLRIFIGLLCYTRQNFLVT